MNNNRFLLAVIIMLTMTFTYSCSSEEKEKDYYARIASTGGISYTSLYPNVIMEPGGYFLNEMAQYASGAGSISQYGEDICSHIVVCDPIMATMLGTSVTNCCQTMLIKEHLTYRGAAAMKDWLKSMDTPFYNDIISEIFVGGNSKFLGFYQVDGQEFYIFVSE